ncbi:putative two-component system sensor kinase [Mycena metata]|uniref:Two-component system sensor kinase n=1 Tax=Mycena metata TaxID=1033252 RepID=A0AAD7ITQ5_9AGAR|nr:putative two-component system sensor kinase [Mycena metata]
MRARTRMGPMRILVMAATPPPAPTANTPLPLPLHRIPRRRPHGRDPRQRRDPGRHGRAGGVAVVEGSGGFCTIYSTSVCARRRGGRRRSSCAFVATGDLTQKITVPVQGDLMVQLKKVINIMVDNLGHFATEVTRVSRDVGTEGNLGAQAHVEDVEGTWRELTDEVNTLAANLTTQVRGIAAVTSAVAKGDLGKQIDVDANGEILDLKNTVNGMVLRLRTLTVEVTQVTLEVRAPRGFPLCFWRLREGADGRS